MSFSAGACLRESGAPPSSPLQNSLPQVPPVVIWKGCDARHQKKTIGEPDAGNPPVRFDEGTQDAAVTYCAWVLLYSSSCPAQRWNHPT